MVGYSWAHAHLKEANWGLEWQPSLLPLAEAFGHRCGVSWLHWLLQLCPRYKKIQQQW